MVETRGNEIVAREVLDWLNEVLDPEVPVLSVVELGIIRRISVVENELEVTITPTYSGCPALETIKDAIRSAVSDKGFLRVDIITQLSPAWTTEWIPDEAREKLRAYGISPPMRKAPGQIIESIVPFSELSARIPCPNCDSLQTDELSRFGATACKALYRCRSCREPFEYFKMF
jgi:ring-1,2-phenylacetyl-CoA epoxidase subunit PaaD